MNTAKVERPPGGVATLVVDGEPAPATFRLSLRERRGLLAAMDFAAGALACLLAFGLHPGHIRAVPVLEPFLFGALWVLALLAADGYGFNIPSHRPSSAIAVIKALPVALMLAVLSFFLHPYVLNRTIVVLALLIGAGALVLMRVTAARLLLHESLAVRAVLLADAEPSADTVSTLRAARFEYRVVSTLVEPADTDEQRGHLLEKVRRELDRHHADELIVTSRELRLLPGLAEACLTQGVRVLSASDLVERYMGRVPIETVDVHWYLGLPDNDLMQRPYAFARRVADIVLAIVFSIPFLVLLPLAAVLIKLDSPGPVFLVQDRAGRHGTPFGLLKLRTMRDDAETDGVRVAEVQDARITRVGRFLRAAHLDEFAQLTNIVVGEMSFIGPRPERPEIIEDLEQRIPHFRTRLLVKPGLTGWAQVNAGYASTVEEMTRKLEYDLYYIRNRSMRLDLQILASTFIAVFGRRGR